MTPEYIYVYIYTYEPSITIHRRQSVIVVAKYIKNQTFSFYARKATFYGTGDWRMRVQVLQHWGKRWVV